jgi:hypothetical protein
MKNFISIALASALLLPQFVAAQTEGKEWLNAPRQTFDAEENETVGTDQFFEVTASKLPAVLSDDLKDAHFVALDDSTAQAYKGSAFHCPSGLQTFLLRAVYGNRGTGSFHVVRTNASVLISHASLGRTTRLNKTALVACLRNAPDAVYTKVSIAE